MLSQQHGWKIVEPLLAIIQKLWVFLTSWSTMTHRPLCGWTTGSSTLFMVYECEPCWWICMTKHLKYLSAPVKFGTIQIISSGHLWVLSYHPHFISLSITSHSQHIARTMMMMMMMMMMRMPDEDGHLYMRGITLSLWRFLWLITRESAHHESRTKIRMET